MSVSQGVTDSWVSGCPGVRYPGGTYRDLDGDKGVEQRLPVDLPGGGKSPCLTVQGEVVARVCLGKQGLTHEQAGTSKQVVTQVGSHCAVSLDTLCV